MSDLFRPERMSKVSVTGAKSVMDDVIETVHDLRLLHLSEYDGSWEAFSPGDPVAGADDVSEKLVTVRSLESILGVEEDDADAARLVTDEAIEEDLEEIRQRVNELDDRRTEVDDELRAVEDAIDAMAPFAALGIDLDLLSGYDTLQVAVGEGDAEAVRAALAADEYVDEFELFTGDGVVAAFAKPAEGADEDALTDALVGVDFGELEVPDLEAGPVDVEGDATPETYLQRLRSRRDHLASRLETVENELEDEKLDVASFLLAVEETLSIEVQKREAPLAFATTDNAFVAEGWIPSDTYELFEASVTDAVDGRVEVEELERAAYDDRGHAVTHEEVEPEPPSERDHGAGAGPRAGEEEETTEPQAVEADGGVVTMHDDGPPIIQRNPGPASPFELLVEAVAPPRYDELDPTIVLWMTFPAFFGFMIGDVGYGILYAAIGWFLWTRFDDDVMKSMGGITLWAGGFTVLFGFLYGELFGMHWFGEMVWGGAPPIHKGLSPAHGNYAQAWLVVSVMVGLFHMTAGFGLDFVRNLAHGVRGAVLESASWAMLFVGLWVWIFSTSAASQKPEFLFTALNGEPLPFGFAGFGAGVGMAGLGVAALGLVLAALGEMDHYGPVGAVVTVFDSLEALVHVLSYARIAAVLLAKAGMAFVVNVLVFGAYTTTAVHDGHEVTSYHFGIGTAISDVPADQWMFEGLIHPEFAGLLGVGLAILLFVLGHLLVLVLGVTSAGLQAIRLEYVEFFTKFYEGGGTAYDPFGRERTFSTED